MQNEGMVEEGEELPEPDANGCLRALWVANPRTNMCAPHPVAELENDSGRETGSAIELRRARRLATRNGADSINSGARGSDSGWVSQ